MVVWEENGGTMKELIAIAALVALLMLGGCAQGQSSSSSGASSGSSVSTSLAGLSSESTATSVAASAKSANSVVASVGDIRFEVALADTDAARALVEKLKDGPVALSLHAYGGFEQVGPLPWSLPASDGQITTQPGDIMLYQGDQITFFTGSNSWAYTPLGSIENATSETLFEAFGGDTAEVTLSLA